MTKEDSFFIEDYFGSKRFLIILIVICIMFLIMILLLWNYIDTITKHPCELCVEKAGENVYCRVGTVYGDDITFYTNGSSGIKSFGSQPGDILIFNESLLK